MANLTVDELLRQGTAAARAGDVESARKYFRNALDEDERNIAAWLGLAGAVESEEEKKRCFERVLELDPGNQEAMAGLEWMDKSDHDHSESSLGSHDHGQEVLHCANHPDVETYLRCNRCGKPICTKCAVHTPVGYRCKECVAELQSNYYTAKGYDYPLAGAITFVLAFVTTPFVLWLATLIPLLYSAIIMFFAAPAVAGGEAEIVRQSIGRRRGRRLWLVVCIAAVIGSLLGLLVLWWAIGWFPTLVFLIYVVLFTSTMYARTK